MIPGERAADERECLAIPQPKNLQTGIRKSVLPFLSAFDVLARFDMRSGARPDLDVEELPLNSPTRGLHRVPRFSSSVRDPSNLPVVL